MFSGLIQELDDVEPLFYYEEGKSPADYTNTSFKPIFIDEFNATVVAEANTTCKGNKACVFDLLATKDEDLALTSAATSESEKAIAEVLGKS